MLDVVEPELVAVPERDEEDDDDEPPDERELAEDVTVDLRDPVPITVTLAEREVPALAAEPVGFVMGVTKVEFWPAGTTAAAVWEVATAG